MKILQENYTFSTLSQRRCVLDNLAHLLSEKEIVQGEELRKMLSESTNQGIKA
jgi:hypothetical protein